MLWQLGQGTFTVAMAFFPAANPLPSHFKVTPNGSPHAQQVNSKMISSSNMNEDSSMGNEGTGSRFGRGGPEILPLNQARKLLRTDAYLPSFLAPYLERACLRSATPC